MEEKRWVLQIELLLRPSTLSKPEAPYKRERERVRKTKAGKRERENDPASGSE